MDDLRQRMNRLRYGLPDGKMTPVGYNRKAVDEAGRLFYYQSEEEVQRKRIEGYKKRDKRRFTFAHMRNIREVTDNLSNKLCGYVLLLQPYVQYKSNLLVTQGKNPKPLDRKGIAKIFGIHPKHAKKALDKLEEAGIVETTDDGHFRMNDRYHFRKKAGRDADMLIKTFHTTLKALNLSPAEMGFLYKLLPYVHYDTNLICANPFEEIPDEVRYLNKTQIAETVGMSRQKVEEVLRKLKKSGALVTVERKALNAEIADEGDGRDTLVILNPRIFSRLRGDHDAMIMQMFAGI